MAQFSNEHGVILTIDFLTAGDRGQIVIPMVDVNDGVTTVNMCKVAVEAVETNLLDVLLPGLSNQTHVVGIGAHGMVPGAIPFRRNYEVGAKVGQVDEDPLPASVGGIVDFYFDPSDVSPGNRTKVSHNTVPGLADSGADGKTITTVALDALTDFATDLVDGLAGGEGSLWKRVHAVVKDAGADVLRIAIAFAVNQVVGSVRRRLKP